MRFVVKGAELFFALVMGHTSRHLLLVLTPRQWAIYGRQDAVIFIGGNCFRKCTDGHCFLFMSMLVKKGR